eukprot:scaffold62724_cov19-Tisochrysis_lutea.AAC.6
MDAAKGKPACICALACNPILCSALARQRHHLTSKLGPAAAAAGPCADANAVPTVVPWCP